MRLIFVRHTSVAVERGVCYGQSDVAVASTFEIEAESVRKALEQYSITRAYSSPLSRCTRLASYCGYDDPINDPRLMEMNFGEWEMKRWDDIADPQLQRWYADYLNERATCGESSMDQRKRFERFLANLKTRDTEEGDIVIFTHGGIMIHAMAVLFGMSYEEAFASQPGYGAIMTVDY